MESFIRGIDPDVGPLETDTDDRDMPLPAPLPDMMAIGSRGGAVQQADHNAIVQDAGVYYALFFNLQRNTPTGP